jgi:glycosyltransferase involved in cell wall biosynthesis
LIIATLAERGGVVTHLSSLVPALVEEFDVTVAAHGPGPLGETVHAAGARFVPLQHVRRAINPIRDLLGFVELLRLCRSVRPHVLHANSAKAGLLGRLAAVLARVPVRLFNPHGWAFATHPGRTAWMYLWGDRLMRPLTAVTICVSESERRRGLEARTCDPDRTAVIYNGVDLASFPPRAQDGAEQVRVLSVGRLKAPKDFSTQVRALATLPSGSFRCRIIGDGPGRPALEAELRRLGLLEVVELAGEREDVPEQLAKADVFVLSTTSEGFPMTVLEAMAAGLPVVASAVGGVPELVLQEETGLLVPARDHEALAAALDRLISDRDLRRRFGEAGRKRAQNDYDLASFRNAHRELYRRELAARGLSSLSSLPR